MFDTYVHNGPRSTHRRARAARALAGIPGKTAELHEYFVLLMQQPPMRLVTLACIMLALSSRETAATAEPHAAMIGAGALVSGRQQAVAAAAWPAYTSLGGGRFRSLGNHRFNVTLPAAAAAGSATASAEWRRSDSSPLDKAVFITTASNHTLVECSFVGAPTADAATFAFVLIGYPLVIW